MTPNFEMSEMAASLVKPKKHECYLNAFKSMSYFPNAIYCEGYASMRSLGVPLEHGWLEVDGEIVDPSWYDGGEVDYEAVVKLSMEELLKALERTKRTLPVMDAICTVDAKMNAIKKML